MGESGVLRRPLPLLAAVLLTVLEVGACRPTAQSEQPQPSTSTSATSNPAPPLDPEGPREIVLGKLFAPDGSIQAPDRTTKFLHGALVFLSIESGDLPPGTPVIATWTAPDGTITDQALSTIGGETYLVFTAPSAGWTPGAGRVAVRIGEASRELLRREMPFEVSP